MEARPKILHPTDFSRCAERAQGAAIGLARVLGAEMILLHVLVETVLYGERLMRMDEAQRIYEAQRRWVTETLEARVADTRTAGVPASLRLRVGSPYEEIVRTKEVAGRVAVGPRTPERGEALHARRLRMSPRVLVVDDQPSLRTLYREEFEDEGYAVKAVPSGPEALAALEGFAPDIVLLDLKMSGIDGTETLRRIKARRPGLPVVLCTAYEGCEAHAAAQGCDACVVKSSDLSDLKAAVRHLLRARAA